MSEIPQRFTGQAAMSKQDEAAFDLKEWAYAPRAFTEDDVVIKVECCGICGSDLHTITCGWSPRVAFPAIVGHEIVGKVVKAGSKSGHKLGDRVGFGAQCNSCRKCPNCARGLENYCLFGNVGTYQGKTGDKTQPVTQGGYADFYQGPGHFAIPIPDALEPEVAAPMLCAGVTVYSPLKNYGAGPGKRVGIVGIGGLGHLAVQFSAALGAETWAISHSERKKDDALKLGAVGFIATKDEKAVLKKHLASFDLLLVTSNQDDMPLRKLYLPLLKPYGNCIMVGLPNSGLPAPGGSLFGKSVSASGIGSPQELREMFDLAVQKGVKTWIEKRPMNQATKAVQDMHEGKARYRYVLVNDDRSKL